MKWKKIRKILVLMAVTAACLFGANGVTAYANVDENAVAEAEKQAQQTEAPPAEEKPVVKEEEVTPEDAFSVPGNGEVVDHITKDSSKEFYTIRTANNNTFYLVVDKAQNTQNVYMLSTIDENDLQEFLDESEKKEPETEPSVVIPETEQPPEEKPKEEEPQKDGSKNMMGVIGLVAFLGLGGFYFLKIRSKKETEEAPSENLEIGDGLETVNEDEDE
ncbi:MULTISPECIES: CD1107 family mobile element protein [unclassified Blautia]|uniref:CD1107 family mobile element protein n=1 Tax=unclassified Blautia TaxID=2648079 RepID=UPI001FD56A09|nr:MULTISPECIES: DUF4366 domain-containing protein [unclassified Blautia]MCJ7860289.1 DUF4366 domain-containing protein [Blautia sp. NSJ-157]MCJ7863648.1 DUF4366 domain-containing protein [Blautia sp. NSJ-140]